MNEKSLPLNSLHLKLLAMVTMLIDHMGFTLFPYALWMRCVGRLAFPIFCFLVAEGCAHTHDKKRYAARLLVFAVLSEPAFDLMHGVWFTMDYQNVLWTLLLGALVCWAVEWASAGGALWQRLPAEAAIAVGFLLAQWLNTDYGGWGVLLVLLFLGVPISYAIAVSSLTAILSSIDLNVAVLTAAQRTFVGMSKFSLTAIPFFILAGNIMNQGGIAKRLVDFVMAILGKMPGALLVTNIGTNALFGAISGSASAAAAAVGSMIRDGADEQGYDPAVTAATNAASSCSGLLIPPSNALITYSLASGGTSVAALFMAGYIPGIIWALCCCVVGVLLAIKLGYKGTPGKFDWKNLGVCTLRALPSLSLIIVVIGGIIGGVFSATEGSAIAVVYALVLAFCYRSINLKSLWKIIVDSAKMSGMVVFLVGVSNILGWVMAFLQIPDAVAAALLSLTSNKYIILLIMNVILLVSGTFMDVTPAILIFTPLFLPICQSFGMSTIQFGLILVYNLCIGNITPPVGNALFVGIKVGRTSLSKVMPYMLMYYVAIIGGLLLVTFIPAVSTALPQAMGLM